MPQAYIVKNKKIERLIHRNSKKHDILFNISRSSIWRQFYLKMNLKKIIKIEEEGQTYLIKQYYQHDNYDVFLKLKRVSSYRFPKIISLNRYDDFFEVKEEFIDGKTLNEIMPLYDQDIIEYAIQICEGLRKLEELNIVHRDLKPENIMISKGKVKIIDFDIAKPVNIFKGKDTQILGSVGYAAPEQYGFQVSDIRTDIYSFGNILNEMYTGYLANEKLYDGRMQKVIIKCTQFDPSKRYQNANEIIRDIQFIAKQKNPYTLPGFRTGNPGKMFLGTVMYGIMVYAAINPSEVGKTFAEEFYNRFSIPVILLIVIFLTTNYLDVQRFSPIPNHKIIGTFILGVGTLFSILLLWGIFLS